MPRVKRRQSPQGRPPLPESEKRRHVIQVRLTDDEKQLLSRRARDQHPGAFAREVLLRALRKGRDR